MMEISAMIFIQWVFNLLLVIPIHIAGFKIRARHELIAPAIGVLPQETTAYNLVTLLMWGLPLAITLLSLLDLGLFFLYQKRFHFWIGILEDDQGDTDMNMDRDFDEVFRKNY